MVMGATMSKAPKSPGPEDVKTKTPDPDSWENLSQSFKTRQAGLDPGRETSSPSDPGRPSRILPSDPPTSPTKTKIRGIRIFIVDDDPFRVDALAMDLRTLGAEVAVGDRSAGGYRQAARFIPDAVISDLVRPGEEGFRFIQSLRRHPLLRWSSVMLIRWWEETGVGEGQVALDPVLDQLEELLAPVRIIEERIVAKSSLGDRLEMTGPASLLRILSNAGLSGDLSVNDTWNIFTVELAGGRVLSVHRKGIDGEADGHLQAMQQLLLCDTGRWSFRINKKYSKKPLADIETTLANTNRILSRLFGPGVEQTDDLERHITVRQNFVRTASETMPDAALQVVRAMSSGADIDHFRTTLTNKRDIVEVERIIQTLFRCGAIQYSERPELKRDPQILQASRSAVGLLQALNEMATSAAVPRETASTVKQGGARKGSNKRLPLGAYHLQDVAAERVRVTRHRPVRITADESLSISGILEAVEDSAVTVPRPSATDIVAPDPAVVETVSAKPLAVLEDSGEQSGTGKLVVDTGDLREDQGRAVGDIPPERDRRQMWIAIALALVLGGLLAMGIMMIASAEKGDASAEQRGEP